MTPEQHYQLAEEWLESAELLLEGDDVTPEVENTARLDATIAQVHATLAKYGGPR